MSYMNCCKRFWIVCIQLWASQEKVLSENFSSNKNFSIILNYFHFILSSSQNKNDYTKLTAYRKDSHKRQTSEERPPIQTLHDWLFSFLVNKTVNKKRSVENRSISHTVLLHGIQLILKHVLWFSCSSSIFQTDKLSHSWFLLLFWLNQLTIVVWYILKFLLTSYCYCNELFEHRSQYALPRTGVFQQQYHCQHWIILFAVEVVTHYTFLSISSES